MKILHCADIHLGPLNGPILNGENARMVDTSRCMDKVVQTASSEDTDIILIAGDLQHRSKSWAQEMLKEISIASNWLRKLSAIAPTVLLFGTDNHDSRAAFENIKSMNIPGLFITTKPQLLEVCTKNGLVQIAAVPGMDKGYFREKFPGMDAEDENKAISEALGNVIVGLGLQAKSNVPLVLMSHYTVTGCTLENGEQMFMNADIVIPTAALQASNYDLVCLGHIHKAQEVPNCGRPTFYSGPLNGITFNEEGQEKGFWVHELGKKSVSSDSWSYGGSDFIKTPYREFLTLHANDEDIERFISEGEYKNSFVENKIVRVIYSCTDELNKQFNRKTLEKQLYDAGAFYVSEIRPSKIITTTDKTAMSENETVEDNLKLWLKKEDLTNDEINEILEIAAPLIAEVTASLPAGKLAGIFEPVKLKVKNYRSYKEESFDFTKVKFATVNGPNGIGKSSFFMDAIADCLYEETREGELTGWISNSEEVRSGAITFEFKIGEDIWRVIRTRAKSGKATLTLQKHKGTEWKDESCSRKDQTQEKILNILGMDSLTFKSCALIMQDNYGAFLEADKADRMSVLSNILGLNIYEKLQELAKNKAREINRKVEKLKAEIAVLDEKSKDTKIIEERLRGLEESKVLQKKNLEEKESNLKELQEKAIKFKVITEKITGIVEKLMTTNYKLNKQKSEKEEFTKDIENAQKVIEDEDLINEKVSEYEKTKESMTTIKAKENTYSQKIEEKSNVTTEIITLKSDIEKAQKIVDKKDIIQSKIKEYEEAKEQISAIKIKEPIYCQKKNELKNISSETEKILNKEKKLIKQIKDLEEETKAESILEVEVKQLNSVEKELQVMEELKNKYENANAKSLNISQNISLSKKDYKSKKEKIETDLLNCKRKTELIQDSQCPVNNPTCNFLKDALEAKNRIVYLEAKLENLNHSVIDKLEEDYEMVRHEIKSLNYDPKAHQQLKNKFEVFKKSKEKLNIIKGKKPLLETLKVQKNSQSEQLGELLNKKDILDSEIAVLDIWMEDLENLKASMPALEHWNKGKDELPRAEQTLKDSGERLKVLQEKQKKLTVEIAELEKEQKQQYDLSHTLVILEPYIKKKQEVPAAKQLIKSTNERIKTLNNEIAVMEKEIVLLEAEKNKLETKEKELYIYEPEIQIEDEEKVIQVIRSRLSDFDIEIGKCQVQMESIEKAEIERLDKNKKLSVNAEFHSQYEILAKAFSIDGVPFQIVRSVVPELSTQANEILSQMTGGKMAIEMKTDKILKNKKEVNALEIWISDYQRGTMPYLSRSGGQKVKASFAVAFALADLKAKRVGIQLGMLFIDEVPFLDEEGVQAYCDALETISIRYSNMKVIAITHDRAMKGRFPQDIDIISTPEGSKIIFNS